MRHGYPMAMGHGAPITILKRGPNGASQIDTQVKHLNIFIKIVYHFILKILLNSRLDLDLI